MNLLLLFNCRLGQDYNIVNNDVEKLINKWDSLGDDDGRSLDLVNTLKNVVNIDKSRYDLIDGTMISFKLFSNQYLSSSEWIGIKYKE